MAFTVPSLLFSRVFPGRGFKRRPDMRRGGLRGDRKKGAQHINTVKKNDD